MVKTVSGAYLTLSHFTAEVSVNVAAGDIAYFGFGQAIDAADYFHEPSNCFLFRIQNLSDSRIDIAATQVGAAGHFLDMRRISAFLLEATCRFRIVRDGDYVTLSVPSQNFSRTYSISQYNAQLGLTADNTYLFFGNTVAGTVFSDFTLTQATPEDGEGIRPGRR